MSARDVRSVPRFGHGSRVPGWDEAADLSKPPAVVPDAETTPVPPQLREKIVAAMGRYDDRRSAAIPALHAAQQLHGWCSPEAIEQVAAVMQVTPAYLTSVATFYDMLETNPKPKHDVYVCTNISCSLRGADEFFEAMEEAAADSADVNVRSFECLGACDIAPMASVDGEYVGPLVPADAARIIEDIHAGAPVLQAKQLRYRPCMDPKVSRGAEEFGPPPPEVPRADTAGLGDEDLGADRAGPTAPLEVPREEPKPEPAADERPDPEPGSSDAPDDPPRTAPPRNSP